MTKKSNLAQKITRYQIMRMHMEHVRSGKLREARLLLHLLNRGYLTLGFEDEENYIEILLERIGLTARYSRNYNTARFNLPKEV